MAQGRLDLAQQLGIGEAYNVAEIDTQELASDLKARDIDVVVDASGHQGGLDLATDIVRRGGLINLFGWIKGDKAQFDPTKWHLGGPAIRLIHKGIIDLKPLVTPTTSLEDYPALMGRILEGDESYIKGVVKL